MVGVRVAVAKQHHLATQGLDRLDLHLGRGGRHDDHRPRAQSAGAQGHALGMVAGRSANHPLFELLGAQVGHLVVGPTQLEAEHGLLVFTLEQDLVAQAARQVFGGFEGRFGGHVIDLGIQDLDQVIGGVQVWLAHVLCDAGGAASPKKCGLDDNGPKKCPKSCDLGQIHLFRGWRRQRVRAKKARLFAIVGVNCCNAADLAMPGEKNFAPGLPSGADPEGQAQACGPV
jgi:hypothetical protein